MLKFVCLTVTVHACGKRVASVLTAEKHVGDLYIDHLQKTLNASAELIKNAEPGKRHSLIDYIGIVELRFDLEVVTQKYLQEFYENTLPKQGEEHYEQARDHSFDDFTAGAEVFCVIRLTENHPGRF